MPNPIESNMGPSAFNAAPSENRLVRKWNPKTAISTTPKTTHEVGCVKAAAIPIRKSAVRAPQDVLASWTNAIMSDNRKSTVMLSR